jgi:hypothetical protein
MNDINNKEILENSVVEIRGAYSKADNGLWLVESVHADRLWLQKLNKDMSKSKGTYNTKNWPLRSYSNDRFKRCEMNQYNREHATIEMLCPYVEPAPKKISNEMRILKKGIRKGENYCPCSYWMNNDKSITVYARSYGDHLPSELGNIVNNSDSMTDYFEIDHCYLHPGDKHYDTVLAIIQSR